MPNNKNSNDSVIKEFSRFANEYHKYNIIQTSVASSLAKHISKYNYHTILDIGCGNGVLYHELNKLQKHIKHYYALDLSSSMLELHPSAKNITKLNMDFNNPSFISTLPFKHIDIIASSSALQWCSHLDKLFENISHLSNHLAVAIFTSNTFKTLHQLAHIKSPILSKEDILSASKKFHKPLYHITKEYRLYFKSKKEIFEYIKKSGVSGGEKKLSYKQTKALISSYTYDYLEFEVIFLSTQQWD